jgi:hypothetical protein
MSSHALFIAVASLVPGVAFAVLVHRCLTLLRHARTSWRQVSGRIENLKRYKLARPYGASEEDHLEVDYTYSLGGRSMRGHTFSVFGTALYSQDLRSHADALVSALDSARPVAVHVDSHRADRVALEIGTPPADIIAFLGKPVVGILIGALLVLGSVVL